MEFWSFILLFCLIILISTVALNRSRTKNLPPGPKPFPSIGDILELRGDQPHKSLANLSKTYGPIMSLKLGQVTTIIVSSSTAAKTFLQTNDQFFSNRSTPDAARALSHGDRGLVFSPVSSHWRSLRRICNSHMFSTRVLDSTADLRYEKVQELLDHVQGRAEIGGVVGVGETAFQTLLGLLSAAFFSADLDTRELKLAIQQASDEIGKPNLADYFPTLLKKTDPQGIRRRTAVHFQKAFDLFDRVIGERLIGTAGSFPRAKNDVLQTLISMINEDGIENHGLSITTVKHLLLDLFIAGTETTSGTLEWSIAELLSNPDAMSKAKAELEVVIGKGNKMKESDITRLPYLQAVVKETLRLHPAVPVITRKVEADDVEVSGYTVPKGAQMLFNLWAIGRDSSVWDDPDKFMPERFVGSNIGVRGRDFEFAPFGGGRRICPGLALAMRMLHLMLGSLIHSFDWKLEDGVESPEGMKMNEKFGLTLTMAQPLRAVPRPITAWK